MSTVIALAIALVLLPAAPALAGAGQAAEDGGSFDAAALPVSIDRIRRQLDRLPAGDGEILRLRFYVQVSAPAPETPVLDVFDGFDLRNAPPRYGAPVHAETRMLTTPMRHRFRNGTPAVTTGNLLSWGR